MTAASARWASFLARLQTRREQAFAQAHEAALASLTEGGYDYPVSQRAIIGMAAQLRRDFRQKLEETWYTQAKAAFIAENADWHGTEANMLALSDAVADAVHEWQLSTEAALAEAYCQHVLTQPLPVQACSQCGAPLQVRGVHWAAHYIACEHCRSVITCHPPAIWQAMPDAVETLARWRARGWLARHDVAPTDETRKAYVDAYLDACAALMPMTDSARADARAREMRRLSFT